MRKLARLWLVAAAVLWIILALLTAGVSQGLFSPKLDPAVLGALQLVILCGGEAFVIVTVLILLEAYPF